MDRIAREYEKYGRRFFIEFAKSQPVARNGELESSESAEQGSVEDVSQLTIEDLKIDLIRYYPNLTDEKELGRITLRHYTRLMKAYRLRSLDREFEIHLAAWKRREVEATKGKGRYVFTDFRKFMDFKKRERELLGRTPPKPKGNKLLYLIAKANQSKREGG